jgi:MFS family permease
MYLDSIFIFMFLQRYPNLRRTSCFVGVVFIVISLLASSFASSVWQLILTQGALYAVGGSLLYNPLLLFLDEWFVRRKGIAFGIMWAGTGASGVAIPFLLSWGLAHFSLATILRVWAVVMGLCLGPLLFFIKPRIPVTMSSTELSRRPFDFKFVYTPAFIALQVCNTLQGLGYFIPGIYLPSYAQSVLGLSATSSTTTATLALLNTMGVFGCIVVGFLIDRLHVTTVTALFAFGSIISVVFVWGFSSNASVLLLFSSMYGFFAGSFTTTYTGVIREVKRQAETAETGLILGMLSLGRGIGSVAAGPISEALLTGKNINMGISGSGFTSGYEPLIFFTGACVGLGGISIGARKMGWFD